MGFKSKEEYNEYMNSYIKAQYKKRIAVAKDSLGGKCALCGSIENLEFDHIDPSTKIDCVTSMHSFSQKRFEAEIDKCQLLCSLCHKEKNLMDLNVVSAKTTHGTISSYRYCKCDLCRKAKSLYNKEYKSRKKTMKLCDVG